uniref:Uncharacterized protein n=1 Tax=Rhizophora mucronata TaxID=61149 RepID=A0A2P2QPC0_RHIMU
MILKTTWDFSPSSTTPQGKNFMLIAIFHDSIKMNEENS